MTLVPFAQATVRSWDIGELLIWAVILAAACALVMVAIRQFGVSIPGWVTQVLWICLVALVVVVAIRFVLSL